MRRIINAALRLTRQNGGPVTVDDPLQPMDFLHYSPWGDALRQLAANRFNSYQTGHGSSGTSDGPHSPLNIAAIAAELPTYPPPGSGGSGGGGNGGGPGGSGSSGNDGGSGSASSSGSGSNGSGNGSSASGSGSGSGAVDGGSGSFARGGLTDPLDAALRLARQGGGRADPNYEVPGPNYNSPLDAMRHLFPDEPAGPQTRRERAEALAQRVMDKPLREGLEERGGLTAELTGIPSIARGASRATDSDLAPGQRIEGAAQSAMGALPYVGGKAGNALMGTIPRSMGTMGALSIPEAANAFIGQAHAAEPPRSPHLVKQIQERLTALGHYKGPVDGKDGPATRDAEAQEAAASTRADADRKMRLREMELGTKQSEAAAATAKTEADRIAAEKAEKQIAEGKRAKFDETLGETPAWLKATRAVAPIVVGGGLGILAGGKMGARANALGAEKEQGVVSRANTLLKGNREKLTPSERIGSVNQFVSEGAPSGAGPAAFSQTPSAPYWKVNREAPPSSELYLPQSRKLEHGLNAAQAGTLFGTEAGISGLFAHGAQQEVDAAKTNGDIEGYQSALNKLAAYETLVRMGVIGGPSQVIKGSYSIHNRPSPRPNISRADSERGAIAEMLADRKSAAQAAKLSATQPAPQKGKPKARKPNGGATPLLPLATAPLLGRERTPEEPTEEIASPNSEEGFSRGGIVGHALKLARQQGGRVVHAGPIQHAADGGRTDTVPLDVAPGSYVIPADIISGLGQGDTTAGYKALTGMFGAQAPKAAQGAGGPPVPILAAGGEFVISPEVVAKVGKGDLKSGHEALDLWVKMQRRKTIQDLKQLPGPAQD